jgi:hypothetical protein
MSGPVADPYWNTGVARHPGILRAVPAGCRDALDVGCGDGLLEVSRSCVRAPALSPGCPPGSPAPSSDEESSAIK